MNRRRLSQTIQSKPLGTFARKDTARTPRAQMLKLEQGCIGCHQLPTGRCSGVNGGFPVKAERGL